MEAIRIEGGQIVVKTDAGGYKKIPYVHKEPTLDQVNKVIAFYNSDAMKENIKAIPDHAIANASMLDGIVTVRIGETVVFSQDSVETPPQ
ncbi:MAG: hypothetical protein HQK96_01535 [Nitrospirae bacterium]|nr:hypothetical protein [Nitrospirota bacterium]